MEIAGLFCGSLMLLTPGFITDIIGFLLLFPSIRDNVGKFVTARVSNKLREIYEYLKLYGL